MCCYTRHCFFLKIYLEYVTKPFLMYTYWYFGHVGKGWYLCKVVCLLIVYVDSLLMFVCKSQELLTCWSISEGKTKSSYCIMTNKHLFYLLLLFYRIMNLNCGAFGGTSSKNNPNVNGYNHCELLKPQVFVFLSWFLPEAGGWVFSALGSFRENRLPAPSLFHARLKRWLHSCCWASERCSSCPVHRMLTIFCPRPTGKEWTSPLRRSTLMLESNTISTSTKASQSQTLK